MAQMTAMRKLSGVYVMGEVIGDSTGAIDRRLILEVAEADLRLAGIRILTEEEWIQAEGSPVLYVEVVLTQYNKRGVRYDTRLSLQQLTSGGKEPGTYRILWNRAASAQANSADLETLKRMLSGLMATFPATCQSDGMPEEAK